MTATSSKPLLDKLRKTLKGALGVPFAFMLAVTPVPAARPRVSRWGTYYPKTYKTYLQAAPKHIPQRDQSEAEMVLVLEHVVPRPKTTKRTNPRGDIDNYCKGPMDVITHAESIWRDDDQVVALVAVKRFAEPEEQPGTHVELYEL